jgi:hypothetical protein
MPDDTHPLTTADYEKCEAYLFAKGDLFGSNGMSVSPSSFADVFRSHFGANWEAARQTTKDDSLLATSLAAAVIAQAARESGHLHASSGQFEEPEEEKFVEAFYGLGTALLRENRFSYLEALDRLGQLERLSNARTEQFFKDVENGNDLDKQEVERDKEYFRQVSTILLHPKHRGRTAAEILVEHGFDLPGYIADAGDFGSPDYPAGGSSITPQRKLTAVSAATGTALHPIYISALWHDAISKKSGNTTILIHLTRPLDEILPLKRYRYSGGLNPFSRASADRIYSIQWITHNWDPVEFVCRAARELQFMCATGLVPSKSGGDPGQIGGEFPEWDHASIWTDPSSGATVYASEPYHAAAAEYSCVEWAQLNDSTFVLPKWPGMYTPPWSGLILIARNEHKELLEAARDQLDLLDDCTSPASCNLVEVSENIPFFSPGERMEGRKVALIPPAKNPWKE